MSNVNEKASVKAQGSVEMIADINKDFPQWYTDVILKSRLVDYGPVKGTMVIRPYGYAVWEIIQKELDSRFKATGHQNAYFPLFIPESFLKKEAEHVEGFAPECAMVTRVGNEELSEPLVVRPTSEAIICYMYSKWVQSYRDLPLLYNQWANVVRWEKTTRPFLRTSEFLWQEGHTVHASSEEAQAETIAMLECYAEFSKNVLAMPVLIGKKSQKEKFAGAIDTYSMEAMMIDGKSLQAGTSHYFGQNFAKAFDIMFLDKDGTHKYAYQTSWGVSTRLIGALIMSHGDERGLVFPPKAAPIQVVIVPIAANKGNVLEVAGKIADGLKNTGIRVEFDTRDMSPGYKFSDWEMKGVPLRLEIGPRDIEAGIATVMCRNTLEKTTAALDNLDKTVPALLSKIQDEMYAKAKNRLDSRVINAYDLDGLEKNVNEGNFGMTMWCGDRACEDKIKERMQATSRNMPFDQTPISDKCVCCQKPAKDFERLASTFKSGRAAQNGINVTIAGKPNVGKSSLLNALIGEERAIVTDIAGTTRDILKERIEYNNVAINFIDTAGIRSDAGNVEKIGINLARKAITTADIILFLCDNTFDSDDQIIFQSLPEDIPVLKVLNKSDLISGEKTAGSENGFLFDILISAETGNNTEKLKELIYQKVLSDSFDQSGEMLVLQRHYACIEGALAAVKNALNSTELNLITVDLRAALSYLYEITGENVTEQVIDRIFDKFFGGGHAAVEAGLACAKTGLNTLMLVLDLDSIGYLACNPSIGGTAKGNLVKEIDALGGVMGIAADRAMLQLRMLNASKGVAVQSLRAQVDKYLYHQAVKNILENTDKLKLRQAEVTGIITESGSIKGVVTARGQKFFAGRVIVATGVYLKSTIIIGGRIEESGPAGFARAEHLSESIEACGHKLRRFKTGTPARVNSKTIDYSVLERQDGENVEPFSTLTKRVNYNKFPCYLGYTNTDTHRIIKENLHLAPMYSGLVKGTGARYCPSIEDKVVRFSGRERHQFFLEPEGLSTVETYIQGISTGLPPDVQLKLLRSIKGLENVEIMRDAYAIEYDCIDSLTLNSTLMSKHINNLYFAGQINGTSGYEEAAAQGLIAGLNASLSFRGLPPLILGRDTSYIGVLIDDLTVKGTNEPYRMMTSRAEYRLRLRQNNSDLRLSEIGKKAGLLDSKRYKIYKNKLKQIEKIRSLLPSFLSSRILTPLMDELKENYSGQGMMLQEIFRRTNADVQVVKKHIPSLYEFEDACIEQVLYDCKYEGYLKREERTLDEIRRLDKISIPKDFDYDKVLSLRIEARQKLKNIRPLTLGHASRISGVNPADVAVLLLSLKNLS
ncbi:glucose inhibited division protein a [Holotrichia oblita]|nr:glucose inhibited division protein a [Holotrichia oblita]